MKNITYKITTLSSCILSPRSNTALYRELGDFSLKQDNGNKLKVIYPFYQYGEYSKYDPENAEYYLPGTSIKGMLCQGVSAPADIMVDDVHIENDSIVLSHLYKAQYLNDEKKACFGVFFENVGIEMIKANTKLTGEIYIRDQKFTKTLFNSANQLTKIKLKQMLKYFQENIKKNYPQDLLSKLLLAIKNISNLPNNNNIFLIGGYKGLLHSMVFKSTQPNLEGAIFLDVETMLPHGLIQIDVQY